MPVPSISTKDGFALRMSTNDSANYDWPTDPPSLRHVPYFQTIPLQLEDLIRDSSRRDTLNLDFAPSGCTTVSHTRNCAEACLDPKSLFRFENLRICILMASAALLVQNKTYSVDMLHAPTVATSDMFLVPNLTTFDAVSVLNNVTSCISQSCTSSNLGSCALSVRDLSKVQIVASNLATLASRLISYCAGAENSINSDIAGPGLVLAYLLQISLAVLFHLCLKFTTTWTRGLFHIFSWFRGHSNAKATRALGKRLQSRLAASRFCAAVVSSLVEFQEVQIYFVASIQIATLISFNPDNPSAGSVNSISYGGALLNSIAITSLSITSVSCILLIQRSLQRVGMHWWYPFVTMTVTHALALTIFALQPKLVPSVDGLWARFTADSHLTLCGGNPSPMTYCRPPYAVSFIRDPGSVYAVCFAGSLVWLGLLVNQLSRTPDSVAKALPGPLLRRLRWLRDGAGSRRLGVLWDRWGRGKQSTTGAWVARAYSILISIAVCWMVLGYTTALRPVLARANVRSASGWSFGQFVALAVWIPTVVKHVYYNIFGIEGGFEERIAANYTIRRDDDPKKSATFAEERRPPHAATYPLLSIEPQGAPGGREATDNGTDSMGENIHRTW